MISCDRFTCKHNKSKACTVESIKININGECEKFEKGFSYYTNLVWNVLDNSNFIPELNLTKDLRIGIYYVAKIFGLGICFHQYASWMMITLQDSIDCTSLSGEEIRKRKINETQLELLAVDFLNGILPTDKLEEVDCTKVLEVKEFGFLSTQGKFFEAPFGSHETFAKKICEETKLMREYEENKVLSPGLTYADFLVMKRKYVLIHNPSGDGGYIVTNFHPLTSRQKKFLYEYFADMGDHLRAGIYLED